MAVDPSSPITGGAILGDRVRMQAYAGDRDVFIRSMAARGHAGGLASTTGAACAVLDAVGFELVLVETVGTGQSEVEVASSADTTVVLEAPEMGDEVQAIKAGLLEVADIVVVNKGDRPGAARTAAQLRAMLVAGTGRQRRARGRGAPTRLRAAVPKRPEVMITTARDRGRRRRAARGARSAPARRRRGEPVTVPRARPDWRGPTRRSGRSSPSGSPSACGRRRSPTTPRRRSVRSPTTSWTRSPPPTGCSGRSGGRSRA